MVGVKGISSGAVKCVDIGKNTNSEGTLLVISVGFNCFHLLLNLSIFIFNDMIEEQKENLKGGIDEEVTTLNMNIDKFNNRWKQLKPTEMKSWEYSEILKIFDSLIDWKKQFADLESNSVTLTENCATFGLQKPRFDGLENLIIDIKNTTKSWDLLKEYYDELNLINVQDWLTFSVNVYVLQDFAMKWVEILKNNYTNSKYDSVGEHIITTVEKIKKCIPSLKYCQGTPFKEDHWAELLQGKLQLNKDVKRDNLLV